MKKLLGLQMIILFLFFGCDLYRSEDYSYPSRMDIESAPIEYDASNPDITLNVATVAIQCDQSPDINRLEIERWVQLIMAEQPDTELIVFGETITGWYVLNQNIDQNRAYIANIAESIPGTTSEFISNIAQINDIYISFGITEEENNKFYNSSILIDPEGIIQAKHRKVLLIEGGGIIYDEPYEPGINATITEIKGIRTGIIICNDMHSISLISEMNLGEKLDMVLHPSADTGPFDPYSNYPVSHIFNSWTIVSNRFGAEDTFDYPGSCLISDPGGKKRVGGEGKPAYYYFTIGIHK